MNINRRKSMRGLACICLTSWNDLEHINQKSNADIWKRTLNFPYLYWLTIKTYFIFASFSKTTYYQNCHYVTKLQKHWRNFQHHILFIKSLIEYKLFLHPSLHICISLYQSTYIHIFQFLNFSLWKSINRKDIFCHV